MKEKVLIFSTAYLPLIGGAEVAVKEITDRLGGDFVFSAQGGPVSGWNFDLICAKIKRGLPAQERLGNINVYRVGFGLGKIDKLLLPWRGAALANKLYCHEPYNMIWAIMASFGGLAALFFKIRHPRAPYLLTLQEGDSPEHIAGRARWLGPYYKKMFTAADHLTAISQYLFDFGRAQGAIAPMDIVPNGVDVNKFSIFNFQFSKKKFKEKLGIKENDKVVVTASRLAEKNGVGDLIDAINQLTINNRQLTIKLLILGTGPLERELKDKVKRLKLEGKAVFFGRYENDELPKYLAISDVFVRPSLSEGQGISFLEAMAAGVPIIGTKVGGIPDFLIDEETGLFCEVSDPKSIAEKINILLSDEELRQKLILNSRQLVREKYGWDDIAARMKSIFDGLTV